MRASTTRSPRFGSRIAINAATIFTNDLRLVLESAILLRQRDRKVQFARRRHHFPDLGVVRRDVLKGLVDIVGLGIRPTRLQRPGQRLEDQAELANSIARRTQHAHGVDDVTVKAANLGNSQVGFQYVGTELERGLVGDERCSGVAGGFGEVSIDNERLSLFELEHLKPYRSLGEPGGSPNCASVPVEAGGPVTDGFGQKTETVQRAGVFGHHSQRLLKVGSRFRRDAASQSQEAARRVGPGSLPVARSEHRKRLVGGHRVAATQCGPGIGNTGREPGGRRRYVRVVENEAPRERLVGGCWRAPPTVAQAEPKTTTRIRIAVPARQTGKTRTSSVRMLRGHGTRSVARQFFGQMRSDLQV